jgi:hypothetical protein
MLSARAAPKEVGRLGFFHSESAVTRYGHVAELRHRKHTCLARCASSISRLHITVNRDYDCGLREAKPKYWLLQQKFKTEIPCRIVTSEEVNAAMADHGWDGFYKTYPDSGGWIELSAVGFNADRTVAVVYVGHSCGSLCGGGRFHVLQKRDNKWLPLDWKGSSCMWAS